MKRIITLLSLMFSLFAAAQENSDAGYMYVYRSGKAVERIAISEVDSICFTAPVLCCEAVDLGLPSGLKWASCNIGADAPEEYGSYFAWGETVEKEVYTWETYKLSNGTENVMTKYCTNAAYGATDNRMVLEPEDDAAHVAWGDGWRMPTVPEQEELLEKCKWTWTSLNGVNGYRIVGPNGNSIFMPATGFYFDGDLYSDGTYGYYWTSSLREYNSYYGCYMYFYQGIKDWYYYQRYYGFAVRPVRE